MKKSIIFLSGLMFMSILASAMTPAQGNWRWRANDGTETEASFLADQNVSIAITDDSELRIRMNVFDNQSKNRGDTRTIGASLLSIESAVEENVGLGNENSFKLFNSEFIIDGENSTNSFLTQAGSSSFLNSYMYDASISKTFILNDNRRNEIEFCIKPTSKIKDMSKYSFKIPSLYYPTLPVLYTLFSATQSTINKVQPFNTTSSYLKFNAGNGDGRCIFVSKGDKPIILPINNIYYSADSIFQNGDPIVGSDWYCVYDNSGDSICITRLDLGQEYKAVIYEYFFIEGEIVYMPDTTSSVVFTSGKYNQIISSTIPAKRYGDDDFLITASSDFDLLLTYSSDNDDVLTISEKTIHITGPGIANITISQAGNDTVVPAELISPFYVRKMKQTVDFPEISDKKVGDPDFSGFASSSLDLEIIYSSDNEDVAVIVDGLIHVVGSGIANINALQAGNDTVIPDNVLNILNVISLASINNSSFNDVNVYPNPVINGKIFITGLSAEQKTALQIFDINGRLVYSESQINNEQGIDVSHFNEGLYFIRLNSETIKANFSFMKK